MIARARNLLRAYLTAQLLLAIIAVSFVGGVWFGCFMAVGFVRAMVP